MLVQSVLGALESEESLKGSTIYARALLMRAELHLEAIEYPEAIQVAQQVIALGDSLTLGRAFRISADSYEGQGNFLEAVRCLQQWAVIDPSFLPKIRKEIARLEST
jgi:tetratricopeptide (TPR) repeat protein